MPPKKQSDKKNNKSAGKNNKPSGNKSGSKKSANKSAANEQHKGKKSAKKEARDASFQKRLEGSGMMRMSAVNVSGALTPEVRMLQMRSSTFNQAHYDSVMKICRPILRRFCAEHQIDNAVEGLAMASLSYEVALNQLMAAVQQVLDAESSGSAFNPTELIQLLILGNWYKLNGIFNVAVEDRELVAALATITNSGSDFITFDRITKKLNIHDSMYKLNTLLSQVLPAKRSFKPADMDTVEEWELMGEELAARNNAEAASAKVAAAAVQPQNAVPNQQAENRQSESEYEEEPEYYESEHSNNENVRDVRNLSPEKQAALLKKIRDARSANKSAAMDSTSRFAELNNTIAKAKMAHYRKTKLDMEEEEISKRMGSKQVNTNNKSRTAKSSVLEIKSKHTKKAEKHVVNLAAFKRLVANLDKTDKVLVPLVQSMLVELSSVDNIEAYIATLPKDKQAETREKLTLFVNTRLPVILGLITSRGPKSSGPNNNNGARKQSSRGKPKSRN
jgi:hypothetical protein